SWIYEHFSHIGSRVLTDGYTKDMSQACHWRLVRGTGDVLPVRISACGLF
ncbi:putative serine/threonine-protein phosphatase 7 long form-like protein, partial [Sesbania bispinosa]